MKHCPHKTSALAFNNLNPPLLPVITLRCVDCDAALPMGESNDFPCQVRVEMRAAELVDDRQALRWASSNGWHSAAAGRRGESMSYQDMDLDSFSRQPDAMEWKAGWLAYQILHHNEIVSDEDFCG